MDDNKITSILALITAIVNLTAAILRAKDDKKKDNRKGPSRRKKSR